MPGDEEIPALQVRIVPRAHPRVDPAVVDPLGNKLPDEFLVQFLEDLHRVGDPHPGQVAHAPVGQHLHGRRLALADALAEVGTDLDGDVHLSAQQKLLQLPGIVHLVSDPEDGAPLEGIADEPALLGPRLVEEAHLDVAHVRGDDVAEDEKLDERHDDQNGPVLPVPEELDELLSHDFADPDPVHSIAPLSSF